MAKNATLSTIIDADLKRAVTRIAKAKGMKIRSLVEYALREQLEDLSDQATYHQRLHEEIVDASEVERYFKKLRRD